MYFTVFSLKKMCRYSIIQVKKRAGKKEKTDRLRHGDKIRVSTVADGWFGKNNERHQKLWIKNNRRDYS